MIAKLRALVLAFLVSLLSIPAAIAVGAPCLDVYNCQAPEDTFRPPPFQEPHSYPMQEEEPPEREEEPPEEEDEDEDAEECNKYGGVALGAFLGYMGYLAGPTPLGAGLVVGGAVYSAYSLEEC